ncbi:HK97 family phage prohead protease [Emticicia fontis]
MKTLDKENRFFDGSEFRIVKEGDKTYLEGYGIVFNSDSRLLYGFFKERILPEAVVGADMSRMVSKFNHDINQVLGTTWAGTLTYTTDARGVKYKVELPDTQVGRDVAVLAERGDLRASSFEFRTEEDQWFTETHEGKEIDVRVIKKFSAIRDLSPVIDEAYEGTQGLGLTKRDYEECRGMPEPPTPPEKDGYLKLLCNV